MLNQFKNILALFIFLNSTPLFLLGVSNEINFRHYTSNEGLVHNTVFAIGQDGEGFMWFGTSNGLSKFDGKKFTNYQYNTQDTSTIPGNSIQQIITDKNGDIWILSNSHANLYDKTNDHFKRFGRSAQGNFHIPTAIHSLSTDNNNNIWLNTSSGLYQFDYAIHSFQLNKQIPKKFQTAPIKGFLQDSKNNYWIVGDRGIYQFSSLSDSLKYKSYLTEGSYRNVYSGFEEIKEGSDGKIYFSSFGNGMYAIDPIRSEITHFGTDEDQYMLSSDMVRSIHFDNYGRLWIGTELGVNIYNPGTGEIAVYKQDFTDPESINDNAVYSFFNDEQGNMWVGTYFGGTNVWLNKGNHFKYYQAGEEPYFMSGKAVSQIIEDKNGNLWLGTEDGGINHFNVKEKTFKQYNAYSKNSVSYVNVHALHIDQDDWLWIGTYLGGLNLFKDGKFTYFQTNDNRSDIFSDNIFALHSTENDKVWIGTTNGLCYYDKASNRFIREKGEIGYSNIYHLVKDNSNVLWVGCNGAGVFKQNIETNSFIRLSELVKDSTAVLPLGVIDIQQTKDGLIWIGTQTEGLFKLNPDSWTLENYTMQDGLPDNTIYAIIEDDNMNLWLTTNNGLVQFNPEDKSIRVFTIEDGLPNNQFNFKSGCRHSNGDIYLGTVNGMISFNPDAIKKNEHTPDIRIVEFSIFGKPLKPNDEYSILKQPIFNTHRIELDHNQTNVSFEFTAIDYTAPENNQFAYKMEGLEEEWNEVGTYNRASYTNLPPGQYTFTVKGSNNNAVWNEEGTSIQIIVNPPFWLSIWGYLFYAVVIALILWMYRRITIIREKEKSALKYERLEKEKIREVNQLKLKFFTNISHEFRTPLSLMIDPLDKLLDKEPKNTFTYKSLHLISKNTRRLQLLVNQLLEFRKTESGQFKLKIAEGDISKFVKEICTGFNPLAEKKAIHFNIDQENVPSTVWFDKKVVDIILYNLLSNAFKFTPKEGRIDVIINTYTEEKTTYLKLVVSDTGNGISEEEQQKIFDWFYQVNESKTVDTGSGIGLALVKSLSELHQGSISLSGSSNKGTRFTVILPVSKDSFKPDEINANLDYRPETILLDDAIDSPISHSEQLDKKENLGTLLLAEDNTELLEYLAGQLSNKYKVVKAENGKLAWEIIQNEQPDVLISDVMMPEMDGFELCEKVKNDLRTSHIPVILLTAKTDIEDKKEGLLLGADIYLEKPFHGNILESHLSNIFKMKQTLQKKFASDLGVEVTEVTRSGRDEEFLNMAIKTVHKNMDNPQFKIPEFTKEMAVSKTLLHMKLKEITGKSALEFIQTIRLKEAARLLKSDKYSVSDVADRTGFNDPAYFSKCFKKHFNILPKQYQQNNLHTETE